MTIQYFTTFDLTNFWSVGWLFCGCWIWNLDLDLLLAMRLGIMELINQIDVGTGCV